MPGPDQLSASCCCSSRCLTSLKEEDRLARELEDCMNQLELQEDQSSLGRVCSRLAMAKQNR